MATLDGRELDLTAPGAVLFLTTGAHRDWVETLENGAAVEVRRGSNAAILGGLDARLSIDDVARDVRGLVNTALDLMAVRSLGGYSLTDATSLTIGILAALAAGVDSIEHAAFVDDVALEALRKSTATLVPTVSALNRISPGLGIPDATVRKSLDARPTYRQSTGRAIMAAVRIAAGTDAGTALNPIGGLVDELLMYCEAGMTQVAALRTATSSAGALIGGRLGVVDVGRPADLIVVAEDPREDLTVLRSPVQVVSRGRLMDLPWIEKTLQGTRQSHSVTGYRSNKEERVIIDMHMHVDDIPALGWHMSAAQCVASMDEAKINAAAIMTITDLPELNPNALELIAGACSEFPGRLYPFARIHPWYQDEAVRLLKHAITDYGFRGLKLHPVTSIAHPSGEDTLRLIRVAAEHAVPTLFHCGDEAMTTPLSIAPAAAACPEATIILGHMGGYFHVDEAIEVADRHPNIVLETSAMPYPDKIKEAVDRVGAERVIFGSDGPVCSPLLERQKVVLAGLTVAQEELVLGLNAEKLLRLMS